MNLYDPDISTPLITSSGVKSRAFEQRSHALTVIPFRITRFSQSPGLLNSIKRVTQKSNFYLNSMFRQNYTTTISTNFYYDLPVEVKNVVALSLSSIELPNSWYTISSKNNNNTFKIITKNGSVIKTWDIIIEDGNYTSDTFQSYLNTKYP